MFGYTAREAIGQSVLMLIPLELQDEEAQDAIAHADRNKVEQTMLNLVSNAIKFTDRVRCQTRDSQVAVEVADTGGGIKDELFETAVGE